MEIYNDLVKDSGGACPPSKFMYVYNNFIKDKNINTIVEIGVYNGCFLLPITALNNNNKSYGIDPYTSFIQKDIIDENLYKLAESISTNTDFLNNVHDRLINNIKKYNLNIELIRDYAENAVVRFEPNSIDILHIDGNHDYQSVLNDLNLYNTKIKENSIIVMDDINWKCVNDAMIDFLKTTDKFKIIYSEPEWCILHKIS
jgi:hypothetical protein